MKVILTWPFSPFVKWLQSPLARSEILKCVLSGLALSSGNGIDLLLYSSPARHIWQCAHVVMICKCGPFKSPMSFFENEPRVGALRVLTVASRLVTGGEDGGGAAAEKWLTEFTPHPPNGSLATPHALIYHWNATAVRGSGRVGWLKPPCQTPTQLLSLSLSPLPSTSKQRWAPERQLN